MAYETNLIEIERTLNEETELMFEKLMVDEPVEKLLGLWNVQNKEVLSEGSESENSCSQLTHQPKYNLKNESCS